MAEKIELIPVEKGYLEWAGDMIQKERGDVYYAMSCARLWKQAAKMHRTYGIDNWISREYFMGLWQGSQATADRRLELLRRMEFAGGDYSDGWCPICAYAGEELKGHADDCELAKELADE